MAELPTVQAQQDPVTHVAAPVAEARQSGSEMTILGEGIDRAAEHIYQAGEHQFRTEQHLRELQLHHQDVIQRLMREKDAQVNALAVNSRYSQLRTDWSKRLIEYEQNPQPDLYNTASKEYDAYTKDLIAGAPTDVSKKELSLHVASYRIELLNEAYRLQSKQQLQQFGATFDKMLSNADDTIYATKSAQEMQVQKDLMNKTVDDAVSTGQIRDKEVVQGLRDKVNLLGVSWAESNMAQNPEMVKEGIKSGLLEGVSSQHKYVLENKADETIKTKGEQEKVLLRDALQSDRVQRMMNGEGNSLNIDRFGQVFGPEAKDKAKRELDSASQLYQTIELSKGASTAQLQDLLEKAKPTALSDDPKYGEQMQQYQDVEKIVHQAMSDKQTNAFDYFATSPAVKALDYRKIGLETPETRHQLQEAVLELQKADPTIMPYEYQIMPQAEAEQFIDNFNKLTEVGSKTDGAGVLDVLKKFAHDYKDHLPMALNQLNNTKGGSSVASKLNPLMWHLSNPSTFRLIADALRKDPQEAYARFKTPKEKSNFLTDSGQDPNWASYQSSVFSSNNGSEAQKLVSGTKEAWTAFSRDYVLNGGKIKDASTLFFSPHSYGMSNGVTYARPRVYSDEMGQDHIMSDEQIRLSNNYLDFYPRSLNPDLISPESILNQTRNFTPDQIHGDVKNALKENTFWSTDESESGVYLFTKGSITGAPRQVLHKDGSPVHIRFIDTMQSIKAVPYGEQGPRYTPYTGDTWLDKLSSSILSGS